jgi:hypothetical protein
MKRNLLLCGIVAGPLFIAISLIQAFTRTGFDLARHPISLLGLGSLGWVQIANFVVCGVLYVLGAVGLRSVLQPGRGSPLFPLLAHRAVDPPPSSSLAEESASARSSSVRRCAIPDARSAGARCSSASPVSD